MIRATAATTSETIPGLEHPDPGALDHGGQPGRQDGGGVVGSISLRNDAVKGQRRYCLCDAPPERTLP